MMDRNLGALDNGRGVRSFGLLYQWGRKDPFVSSCYPNTSQRAAGTYAFYTEKSDETTGTVEYSISHPEGFIEGHDDKKDCDWMYVPNDNLWSSTKTIYDPCPPGYRVPNGGYKDTKGLWYTAFGNVGEFTAHLPDYGQNGITFKTTDTYVLCNYSDCNYPATGLLVYSNGNIDGLGSDYAYARYWSCSTYNNKAYCFAFSDYGSVSTAAKYYRAHAFAVRCCRD